MKRLLILLALVSLAFGQGWNIWNPWNIWLGNRLGANLVANGDFHDFTIDYPYVGNTVQVLNETTFDTFNKWSVSNDISWNSSDSTVKYLFSTNQTSQLIQTSANRAYTGDASQLYGFYYTVDTVVTAPDGDFSLKLKWGTTSVFMPFTQGRHYVEIISPLNASTADIVIEATCTTATVGEFYLDNFDLHRVGLVAWWQFDSYYHAQEGTGKTILQDLSGNGHDLAASAGFDWQNQMTGDDPTYKNGNALEFDGVDDYAYRPATSADVFNPKDGSISFAFWVHTGDLSIDRNIMLKSGTAYEIIYVTSDGKLHFNMKDDSGNGTYLTSIVLSEDTDYFIVCVYDKLAGTLNVYIDGLLETTVSTTFTDEINPTDDFTIGDEGFVKSYWDSYIYAGAVFNRALSSTEVQALYGKPKYWTWNETGSLSRDGWSLVLSGGAELTQDVTGLDANRSYKERIRKDGVTASTTVTGVTSKTYTLTNGTYEYVKLQRK